MMPKNKKQTTGLAKTRSVQKRSIGMPALIPAYPGQVTKHFTLEGTPQLLTTTVTTGVIAAVAGTSSTQIQNFATRFGTLFEEYRIVRVQFIVKTFSFTNPGLFVHWLDEKDQSAPTSTEAKQKSLKGFSCASPSPHTLTWTANDPLDLQYNDIGTAVNLATYKIYTDATNFGSSIVVTPYAQIFTKFHVQFRGYN